MNRTCAATLITPIACLAFSSVAAAADGSAPALQWRVENPFPLINSPKNVEYLARGLTALEEGKGFALYSEAVLGAYSDTAWRKGGAENNKDPNAQSYNRDFIHGQNLRIIVKLPDLADARCTWKGSSFQASTPCQKEQTVEIDKTLTKNLNVFIEQGDTVTSYSYTVTPRERIIIGLGDSFSSGEGNPDRPFKWDPKKMNAHDSSGYRRDWAFSYPVSASELADWVDVSCHRSLYSWQFLYALKQSTLDPHSIVKFASFACSGAEIYDGLLVRQKSSTENKTSAFKAPDSQINEATKLLCSVSPQPQDARTHKQIRTNTEHQVRINQCPPEKLKHPDEVLMTLGGNDVGFSGLIAWTAFPEKGYTLITTSLGVANVNQKLTPETNMVCPTQNSLGDKRCPGRFSADQAFDKNQWLSQNLQNAHDTIEQTLKPSRILQLNYPTLSNDESGELCDFGKSSVASRAIKNELFKELSNDWRARHFAANSRIYNNYSVGPLKIKVQEVETLTVTKLQQTVLSGAQGIVESRDIAPSFRSHGFCATKGKFDLEMPTTSNQNPPGYWWPYKPWEYDSGADTARWFRTPNDSLLNQYADERFGSSAWKYGMFHPNQLGHFAMYQGAIKPPLTGQPAAEVAKK